MLAVGGFVILSSTSKGASGERRMTKVLLRQDNIYETFLIQILAYPGNTINSMNSVLLTMKENSKNKMDPSQFFLYLYGLRIEKIHWQNCKECLKINEIAKFERDAS